MLKQFGSAIAAVAVATLATAAVANHLPTVIEIPEPELETVASITERLEALGFSKIENMEQQGQVFTTDAAFQGRAATVKVDADQGTIDDMLLSSFDIGLPDSIDVDFPEKISMNDVTEKLEAVGFSKFRNARLEGEVYEARAEFGDTPVLLNVDLDTGLINDESRDAFARLGPPNLNGSFDDRSTVVDMERSMRTAGYEDVSDLTKDGNVFDGKAVWHGVEYSVSVDAETGIVTFER